MEQDYIWGDATPMECGCIFEETDIGYIMHWCPKHKAAEDMYEALKGISGWLVTSRKGNMPNMDDAILAVRQALSKADRR